MPLSTNNLLALMNIAKEKQTSHAAHLLIELKLAELSLEYFNIYLMVPVSDNNGFCGTGWVDKASCLNCTSVSSRHCKSINDFSCDHGPDHSMGAT
jgi:hypothetical protein